MPLVSTKEMLIKAQQGGYAVGAFNVENMEMAQALVRAAEQMHAPVIMQTTPGTLKYMSPELVFGMASALAKDASVPVALHLDHGDSYDLAMRAMRAGYTSVMIDGSKLPFEDNIVLTASVVAAAAGIPVEAELGTVGGKEDTHEARPVYTDPTQASEFAARTGIDSFAPAIGTAHGVYKAEPKLDLVRLGEIRRVVPVPLVLHGTSGVPEEQVRACIASGICKVNYATELRIVFTKAVREALAADGAVFDPKKYLGKAADAVTACICERICMLGSAGKADL